MVRRYSHTAKITLETGSLVNGEWVDGELRETTIKGQYFPSKSGSFKVNANGRECPVHGEFHTKAKKIDNAKHLCIDSIALDVDIIWWDQFQTHSVIYV